MPKFAKLIEIDFEHKEQVLLTINYDGSKDIYKVKIRTDLENCVAEITVSIPNQEKAIAYMEDYDIDKAIAFRTEMEKIFGTQS